MRKLTIIVGLVLSLVFAATPAVVLASVGAQTIGITFGQVTFSSILGGSVTGNGVVAGEVSDGAIGALRGTANLPLRDQRLAIEPSGLLALQTQNLQVYWSQWQCDPVFGCFYSSGYSTFERPFAQGPVEIRLGSMRGNGTLSLAGQATCVAACPPAGAWFSVPGGYVNLYGAVVGAQDAGNVNMYGPTPVIQ